ncbi:hypothetical protein T03_1182 [Trichinella britovi]|uniref:Uncharacterized protein n=1 Tax=Trichinella britovi TaxID=45882 RepID=A0A0V1CS68_TRIBR|nr:hypothetical protein T03_1182 [Trichinella britovi]
MNGHQSESMESMEMHKVRIISLSPKAVSIQDGMKKLQWNKASLPR